MDKLEFTKKLERRTENFADMVFSLCKTIPYHIVDKEIISQLVRSAGSVGANYIEANESLSKKDFYHRIGICRKESEETRYWLRRLVNLDPTKRKLTDPLINEASEFVLIFFKGSLKVSLTAC